MLPAPASLSKGAVAFGHWRRLSGVPRILMALALIACLGTVAFPAAAKQEVTLVVAMGADPTSLNPIIPYDDPSRYVCVNVYNKLVRLSPDYEILPDLAESWTISPDGKTYTFELHQGVKWHDGEPFTSADVKFTYEAILAASPLKSYYNVIESVSAPDANTVVFKLNQVKPPFLTYLAWIGGVIPKHIYEGKDVLKDPHNEKPIGTGPFRFKEWRRGEYVALVANDNYFEGRPTLDRVVFRVIPEPATALTAFEAGEVDYLSPSIQLPLHEVARLKNTKGVNLMTAKMYSIGLLAFNLGHPILSNVTVRQAINHCIDKKTVVENALYGIGSVATGPWAQTIPWAYNPNVQRYDYDVARANKLLDQAGYPRQADGLRFTLSLDYMPANEDVCVLINDMLAAAGIRVKMNKLEQGIWVSRANKKDYELHFRVGGGVDPDLILNFFYNSTAATNFMGYSNSRVDGLLARGGATTDRKARQAAYFEIQEILCKDVPACWIYVWHVVTAVKSNFRGFPLEPYPTYVSFAGIRAAD